jgi:glutamate formiminotransferase
VIECVPNFSEGRNPEHVRLLEEAIASVSGLAVLHRTSDPDHHRSVITFAGKKDAVLEGAIRAAALAAELIDLNVHRGVHPRLDVLPFVPLAGSSLDECVALARQAGERIWSELRIPIYFYEAAALRPERTKLEEVRRGQFEGIREAVVHDPTRCPDIGGPTLHPTAGAVIVGARKVLIAFNINLKTSRLEIAQAIAKAIRASSGGLPAVKALGLPLVSRNLVQVSMNLTDFERTAPHVVFSEVSRLARGYGVEVEESELIGLMPRGAVEMAASYYLKLSAFNSQRVIENRLEQLLANQTSAR